MEQMVPTKKEQIYLQFSERLHKACDHAGLPRDRGRATELGKLVGVGYKGAGKWLNGDGMPDMGNATDLAKELGVNFEWLMTGRGMMTGEKRTGGALSRHEDAWVELLRQLPPSERTRFLEAVRPFATAMGIKKTKR